MENKSPLGLIDDEFSNRYDKVKIIMEAYKIAVDSFKDSFPKMTQEVRDITLRNILTNVIQENRMRPVQEEIEKLIEELNKLLDKLNE